MIGISQLQFPSKESSKLKFFVYLGIVQALNILTMPTSIAIFFVAVLYRSKVQTFLTYKKIKNEEVNKKEYWKIFIKDNIIKSVFFLSLVGFILYLSFTKTLILAWLLAPIPLTMLIILLQPEVRPKKLNPIALFKNAVNLLLDGARENLFGMKCIVNTAIEHTLPHLSNDSIIDNVNILKDKYGEKVPEPKDVIRNDEFVKFIQYIKEEKEFRKSNESEFINYLNRWCNNDEQVHVSGLTGGQILYLVLKACNSGDSESVAAKRRELAKSLMYAINYAQGTFIPETCFTGIIGAAIKSLEGIHPDIRVEYLMEDRIGTDAKDEACKFIKKELQKKKNHKEILNAWDKSDDSSNQITSNFIQEIRIPLMRNLFSLDCSEQNVIDTIENLEYINPGKLTDLNINNIAETGSARKL